VVASTLAPTLATPDRRARAGLSGLRPPRRGPSSSEAKPTDLNRATSVFREHVRCLIPEMDESRYRLREFSDSDYPALARIQEANDPELPISLESLRHMFGTLFQGPDTRNVVVEERRSGEVVGSGVLFQMPFESEPARLWIIGEVDPTHQREGIGSHLYADLAAEADRRGVASLSCQVLETARAGRAFLDKRGFVERRRNWISRLEVPSADTGRLLPLSRSLATNGVEITTLTLEGAGDPRVLTRVYDLYTVAAKDIPRDGAYTPMPFDQFRQFFLQGENALPDAWFLAKTEDQYVGVSQAAREPARPQVLQQNFTGTLPGFRRRSIALALKLMLLEYAKQHGYARIETSNDSLNTPMWTLNQGLGFQKVRETIQLETKLGGIGPGAETSAR
jgi:ribosomal protein S18 acetylase RimI-like enzyme